MQTQPPPSAPQQFAYLRGRLTAPTLPPQGTRTSPRSRSGLMQLPARDTGEIGSAGGSCAHGHGQVPEQARSAHHTLRFATLPCACLPPCSDCLQAQLSIYWQGAPRQQPLYIVMPGDDSSNTARSLHRRRWRKTVHYPWPAHPALYWGLT